MGLFDRQWQEKDDDGCVGGVLEWLSVDAGGKEFLVPYFPQEGHLVEPLYAFIRKLVPKDIWEGLLARREEFRDSYDDAPPSPPQENTP